MCPGGFLPDPQRLQLKGKIQEKNKGRKAKENLQKAKNKRYTNKIQGFIYLLDERGGG